MSDERSLNPGELIQRLELLGKFTPEGGRFPLGYLPGLAVVRFRFRGQEDGLLLWEVELLDPRQGPDQVRLKPRHVLDALLRVDSEEKAVRQAERLGPLGLCAHGMPIGPGSCSAEGGDWWGEASPPPSDAPYCWRLCQPLTRGGLWAERAWWWLEWATRLRALAEVIAHLQDVQDKRRPPFLSWLRAVTAGWAPEGLGPDPFGGADNAWCNETRARMARSFGDSEFDRRWQWLLGTLHHLCARPLGSYVLLWEDAEGGFRFAFRYHNPGAWPLLALQLLRLAQHKEVGEEEEREAQAIWALCLRCGNRYSLRRWRSGRPELCPRCLECERARRYYRRHRQEVLARKRERRGRR